jgi:hypothetical protein
MRIGLIAQPHNTGIGVQTWEFFRHMPVTKVLLTDLTEAHASRGKVVKSYPERFAGAQIQTTSIPSSFDIEWICQDVDMIFIVETPLQWRLFSEARNRGVKTVLQYNAEFLEYFVKSYPEPDLFMAPSKWMMDEVAKKVVGKVIFEHVPVNTELFPQRVRTKATKFLHVSGHATYMDRNGTEIVEEAKKIVHRKRTDIEIIITSQQKGQEFENYWDTFTHHDADVLLLPRRYGGLSLQMQEAMACGMPVIMPSVSPNTDILHPDSLIPFESQETIELRLPVQRYTCSPEVLANKIIELSDNPRLVETLSQHSLTYANRISWEQMAPRYLRIFEELCGS